MAKKTETQSIASLKTKLLELKLAIKARQEKNTNAHKAIKKQIAQLLTKKAH